MAKVIQFPPEKNIKSRQINQLKKVSDEMDEVIIKALLVEGVDPHELAGLLAHRLGSLLKGFEDKGRTWGFCEKVVRKQAVIDEAK